MKLMLTLTMGIIFILASCVNESTTSCESEEWFQAWDADDNQYIEEDEFIVAMMDVGYFFYWDGNASKNIEPLEYRLHKLSEYGSYHDFDQNQDGILGEEEILESLFAIWDKDSNEYLTCDEMDLEYLRSFSEEFEPTEKL